MTDIPFNTIFSDDVAVKPRLFEVQESDIASLMEMTALPESLVSLWRYSGCGSFAYDHAGERLTEASNMLLHPDEVLELLMADTYERAAFNNGTPFFLMHSREFLLLHEGGAVVFPGKNLLVISPTLRSFFEQLVQDPEFYDGAIEANESVVSSIEAV